MKPKLERRADVIESVRAFFTSRGFLEVETPILVPSPGLDVHLDAFAVESESPARYLITSPEYQMKRLLARGDTPHRSRIFQLTKVFRRGESGSRHNPEFTMLEWYRSGANGTVAAVMRDTEQLVARITSGAVHVAGRTISTRPPFRRLTVAQAFEAFANLNPQQTLDLASNDEDSFFRTLVTDVEPALAEQHCAVFLTDYPASQASLARKKPSDPRWAERFELYVAGVELCNGFGELVCPIEQRARLLRDQEVRVERGLPVYPIDERFLSALAHVPPSGGNALGLDRLAALSCGTAEIAEVVSFMADEL